MNKYIFYFLLFIFTNTAVAQYKRLSDYGNTLYVLIIDYVKEHQTTNSDNIVKFINSADTQTVFSDAKSAGYSKRQLVFQIYQNSFGDAQPNKAIITALHDVYVKDGMIEDAALYGSLVTMGITTVSSIALIRHLYVYLRFDKPLLRYYKANAHRYQTANLGGGYSNMGTNNTNTTTGIPEPFF